MLLLTMHFPTLCHRPVHLKHASCGHDAFSACLETAVLLQAAGMKLGRWNGIGTWDEAEEEEQEEEEFRPIRKGFLSCSCLKHESSKAAFQHDLCIVAYVLCEILACLFLLCLQMILCPIAVHCTAHRRLCLQTCCFSMQHVVMIICAAKQHTICTYTQGTHAQAVQSILQRHTLHAVVIAQGLASLCLQSTSMACQHWWTCEHAQC